jgi:Protein of unknown function (DUF3574)
MRLPRRTTTQVLLLTLSAWLGVAHGRELAPAGATATAAAPPAAFCAGLPRATLLHRTELFFGRNSPQGTVSEQDFQRFLDTEVTPRFPEGLTVIDARGQFRSSASGAVEQEASKLLVLLYRADRRSRLQVEAIRSRYKTLFAQQSVLRVDSVVCAGF